MTEFSTGDAELSRRFAAALFADLSAQKRRNAVSRRPFDMHDGQLGDAFTAAVLHAETGDTRWRTLLAHHLDALTRLFYTSRIDRPGLADGLTGLLLLLENTGPWPERDEVAAALSRRVRHLTEITLGRMQAKIGVSCDDYSFATGIAGVAHYLLSTGNNVRLVTHICDQLADLAEHSFPDGFWTPVSDLDDDLVEAAPRLTFGARDLSFRSGLAGVTRVLAEAATVLGDGNYLDAAAALVGVAADDLRKHDGGRVSRYQTPPVYGGTPGTTAPPGQTWCDGLPGWEVAVAGDRRLTGKLYAAVRYDRDYLDAGKGAFSGPGLCDGVAGRLYLADSLGLPGNAAWADQLRRAVRDYVGGDGQNVGPGFRDGFGGVAAVWFGRGSGHGYAAVLGLLGGVGLPLDQRSGNGVR